MIFAKLVLSNSLTLKLSGFRSDDDRVSIVLFSTGLINRSEPTFVLCLIQDAARGRIIQKLVAQNSRDSQTAIAVADR
jgi:hypothetical protein